jgi:hypothetical protein
VDSVFDLSSLPARTRRKALLHAKNLCVNRKHLRLIMVSRAFFGCLAFFPFIKSLQKALYKHCYNELDKAQKMINPCGWGKDKAGCRRSWRQCCEYDYRCEYLTDQGCQVLSLCCKMWLCAQASDWLNKTAWDNANPLALQCRRYIRMRRRYDYLLRALAIPLRGRCSLEDTFNGEVDWEMNSDVDGWYEGIIIRDRWMFPIMEEANKEKYV